MMAGERRIIALLGLLTLLSPAIQGLPQRDLSGLVGETILLPCDVDMEKCGDLHSIKWYRGSSRIFVFSETANIARSEGDYTARAELHYTPNTTRSHLEVKQLQVADEAVYKCEITYIEVREGCAVVQFINLTALIKPEYVKVTRGDDTELQNASQIGPFTEGEELTLICESGGGKPIPSVTWWNGTRKMSGVYSTESGANSVGTGRNRVEMRLGRGDLGAKYECRATNDALDTPMVSWIEVDVNVRPLKLEMSGVKHHVVQGSKVVLQCDVTGARPAANITWYNGSDAKTVLREDMRPAVGTAVQAPQTRVIHAADGTYTTQSILLFTASRFENGETLTCEATNAVMQDNGDKALQATITLEVLYPPIVTVSPENVTQNESTQFILFCEYEANPSRLNSVKWLRDGNEVILNPERYDGGTTNQTYLTVKNSTPQDQGIYTCVLENDVGSSVSSNVVYVSIYFPPVVMLTMEPQTPVSELDRLNITLLCKVQSGNPDILLSVRWFLDGELLKELPECGGNGTTMDNVFCDIDPSRLLLEYVGRSFHGNYSCEGMNEAGWGQRSEDEELTVYYPPGVATLVFEPSRVVKKSSVTLSCSVEDAGRPETTMFRWLRGTHHIQDVTTENWTIDPVTLETESNFTCLAYNEGGEGEPATVYIEVFAPPAFIERLPLYYGALLNAEHVNVSCRVECSPLCSVQWLKNNKLLDVNTSTPLYTVRRTVIDPDTRTNDFESIMSTLLWNMSAWPGGQLDRIHDNDKYTCLSSSNVVGPGVQSTTDFRVEYPPENVTVSNKMVNVTEGNIPEKVICTAKAYPEASYHWHREGEPNTTIVKGNALILTYPLPRSKGGNYVCEASNRHGNITQKTFINVLYKPECDINLTEIEGKLVLICTANANPTDVDFTWRIKNENDTIEENIEKKNMQSFLTLESYVENFRTYVCFANNTVGMSIPCERDVTGHISWWRKFDNENMIIIIAVIVGAILMVLIVCIIIIIVCRRKRAEDKYPNPSATKDKSKQDLNSSPSDGLLQPDGDKAFYENLPFHGMQSAPSKSQHHRHYNLTSSQHHLLMNPTPTLASGESRPQPLCGSMKRSSINNRTYLPRPPLRLEYQQPFLVTDSVVYADLALANGRRESHLPPHYRPQQTPTEYAILKFHDVGQEIDV